MSEQDSNTILTDTTIESNQEYTYLTNETLLVWQGLLYNHEDSIEYERIPSFSLENKENTMSTKEKKNEK